MCASMPDKSIITSFLRRPQNEQLICGMNGCRVNWLGVIRHEKGYAGGLSLVNGSSEYFVGLKANFDKKNDSGEPEPLDLYKNIN